MSTSNSQCIDLRGKMVAGPRVELGSQGYEPCVVPIYYPAAIKNPALGGSTQPRHSL